MSDGSDGTVPPWRPATRRARFGRRLTAWRRAVLARRRPLAALLTAVAVLASLRTLSPAPEPTARVLVAAHDLASGAVLRAEDLTRGGVPGRDGPRRTGAPSRSGRILAAPLRRGEPLTDVRLVGPSLVAGYDGLVAVPVRLPDAGTVALLTVGDHVDLVAADPGGGGARVVAASVPVLALPRSSDGPRVVGADRSAGRGRGHSGVGHRDRRGRGPRLPDLHVRPLACSASDPRRSRARQGASHDRLQELRPARQPRRDRRRPDHGGRLRVRRQHLRRVAHRPAARQHVGRSSPTSPTASGPSSTPCCRSC